MISESETLTMETAGSETLERAQCKTQVIAQNEILEAAESDIGDS